MQPRRGGASRLHMLHIRAAAFSAIIGVITAVLSFQLRARARFMDLHPSPEIKRFIPKNQDPQTYAYSGMIAAGIMGILAALAAFGALALPVKQRKHAFLLAALLNTAASASGIAFIHSDFSGRPPQDVGQQTQLSYMTIMQALALFTLFKAAGGYFWKE